MRGTNNKSEAAPRKRDTQLRLGISSSLQLLPLAQRLALIRKLMSEAGYVCIGEDGDELFFERPIH